MRENNAGELLVIATELELELLLQRMTVAQQERHLLSQPELPSA
ncbi:MAG: hypothetical protein WCA07_07905 [Gloeobacterales cyanobacterium]